MTSRSRRILLATLLAVFLSAVPAHAARTFTYRAGPFRMGGFSTQFIKQEVRSPHLKGYITRMHARLVDGRGRQVTIRDGMLHHVFFKNLDVMRVKGMCTSRQPEVFYSTGEEDETLQLPPGYGYRLRPKDRWQVSAMLMSHEVQLKTVYIEYAVRVATQPLQRVRPLWVRANGCGPASSYGVPGDGAPGSVDVRSYHWNVPLNGRIVAAGGHLHAGAVGLQVRQPACGNRLLWDNVPHYGPPDSLPYVAKPMLHEAGPVNTSWFSSETGVSIRKGDSIDVDGLYEGDHPRGQVMAITHVYVAPDGKAAGGCAPLPADMHQTPAPRNTRASAPYQPIPLWTLGPHDKPVQLAEPAGRPVTLGNGATVKLIGFAFRPENVVLRVGDTLNWKFVDRDKHNLTFASGPRAIAGQTGEKGQQASTTFDTPGRYQLFCYLHPMTMREQITVVPR